MPKLAIQGISSQIISSLYVFLDLMKKTFKRNKHVRITFFEFKV